MELPEYPSFAERDWRYVGTLSTLTLIGGLNLIPELYAQAAIVIGVFGVGIAIAGAGLENMRIKANRTLQGRAMVKESIVAPTSDEKLYESIMEEISKPDNEWTWAVDFTFRKARVLLTRNSIINSGHWINHEIDGYPRGTPPPSWYRVLEPYNPPLLIAMLQTYWHKPIPIHHSLKDIEHRVGVARKNGESTIVLYSSGFFGVTRAVKLIDYEMIQFDAISRLRELLIEAGVKRGW